MKRRETFPFIWVFAAMLALMSLPTGFIDTLRSGTIAVFAPLWEKASRTKEQFWNISTMGTREEVSRLHRLQLENTLLQNHLSHAEKLLQETVDWNRTIARKGIDNPLDNALVKGVTTNQSSLATIPARVIYRASSTWNSALWINVGEYHNTDKNAKIIAKNSPVVIGNSLVGVIDYVGNKQSRVCLITDARLIPSVRAVRGDLVRKHLSTNLEHITNRLNDNENVFASETDKDAFFLAVEKIQQNLEDARGTTFLAKGELHGNSAPLWRSPGSLLKGIGFNCDYADDITPARDLRRGTVYGKNNFHDQGCTLLQVHDLLITTGMDGIFPAGLHVAEVVQIEPLKEGDYYYELKAMPTAGNIDDISLVFVLPPISEEDFK